MPILHDLPEAVARRHAAASGVHAKDDRIGSIAGVDLAGALGHESRHRIIDAAFDGHDEDLAAPSGPQFAALEPHAAGDRGRATAETDHESEAEDERGGHSADHDADRAAGDRASDEDRARFAVDGRRWREGLAGKLRHGWISVGLILRCRFTVPTADRWVSLHAAS
jgi:hypothetical protein